MTTLGHDTPSKPSTSTSKNVYALAVVYVGAAAAANLLIAHFGPPAVPVVSFLLVGFIITTRDRLHDAWQGRRLSLRLGGLITAGALVSYFVNADAANVAIASATAFAVSETVNAFVYQPLLARGVPWLARVNLGNVPNAILDSVIFVSLAFGFSGEVVAAQVVAKVLGGALWSLVLARRRPRRLDGMSESIDDQRSSPPPRPVPGTANSTPRTGD